MSAVNDYAVLRKPARTQAPPRISTDLEAAGTFAGNDLCCTLEAVCFCALMCIMVLTAQMILHLCLQWSVVSHIGAELCVK